MPARVPLTDVALAAWARTRDVVGYGLRCLVVTLLWGFGKPRGTCHDIMT